MNYYCSSINTTMKEKTIHVKRNVHVNVPTLVKKICRLTIIRMMVYIIVRISRHAPLH